MLVSLNSTRFFAKNESGGKGYNLYVLTNQGISVPEWTVFGVRYYRDFIKETGLDVKINLVLSAFVSGALSGAETEKEIQVLFDITTATKYLEEGVRAALKSMPKNCLFSVRSSAADEDSVSHSFAGQLSSFLYVQGEVDIIKYIKRCWASAYSERSLSYRKENQLDLAKISVAVVLQRMIDPDKSGVLFTCDPVEKTNEKFVISSVYGVGEGLVSGALDADSFWLNSKTGEVLKRELVSKEQKMKSSGSGHCELQPVEKSLQEASSLTDNELRQLHQAGVEINRIYNRVQDVEWAIENGKLYILQARPVTALDKNVQGYPNLWDNANIVESYGGLTLPLSFSFALRNYKNVYVQFCEVLNVPAKVVREMDDYLGNMLGCLHGRVYYNLFNWYKLVGVLPGFRQNKEFMETMMGVQIALSDEINERIMPHSSWNTWQGKVRQFITGISFVYYHFSIQSMVDGFLKEFREGWDYFRKQPYAQMRGDQMIRIYLQMEQKMLGKWKAPIINDFLCMVHFGLLRKLTTTWLKDLDGTIQNDLVAAEGGLESAEPMKVMVELAIKAKKQPELAKLILDVDPKDGLEAIGQSEFKDFHLDVLLYLDKFGFRCMSEMKLEEVDLNTDPSYLFVCLKNYLKSDRPLEAEGFDANLRKVAEDRVKAHLSGIKNLVFFWVLKHARKAIKNRENTRFARTRIYGVARLIFQFIGEDLASQNILDHQRDVFWLTIEEVFGIYNGTLTSSSLKEFVAIRKTSYDEYDKVEVKQRALSLGPVYWGSSIIDDGSDDVVEVIDDPNVDLKGLPCCPGVIEGVVKVIMNPSDNLDLNGEILVTARTDPGWVPLYPSISGLLVERGSLLSHSAIVAREMGIPAIVSIPGLLKKIKTGMRIRLDGKAGTIKILDENT